METPNTFYQIGEHVVYPLQGVGVIKDITKKKFKGKEILYYVIFLDISDMTVMIPVDNADDIGIRSIVSTEEAMNALDSITGAYEPVTVDWKVRYTMNLELLKEGTIASIASVVQTLYHRSKIKELPVQERKLYDNALRILIDEISLSIGKPKPEIEALVLSKLEAE